MTTLSSLFECYLPLWQRSLQRLWRLFDGSYFIEQLICSQCSSGVLIAFSSRYCGGCWWLRGDWSHSSCIISSSWLYGCGLPNQGICRRFSFVRLWRSRVQTTWMHLLLQLRTRIDDFNDRAFALLDTFLGRNTANGMAWLWAGLLLI